MAELDDLLAGLRAAALVERTPAVLTREQRRHLARVVDRRLRLAAAAGAATSDLAEAFGRSIGTTRTRLRRARLAAPLEPAQPALAVVTRPAQLATPRCALPLPPPASVWARCTQDRGHRGDHG